MIEKVLSGTKEEIVKEAKSEINSATNSIREQMRYQKDTDLEDIRNRNARELQNARQFANNGNFRAHNN